MQKLTKDARADLIDTAYYSLSTLTEPARRPTMTLVLGQTGAPTALVQREIEALRRPHGGAVLISGYDMDRMAAGEGFDADEVDSQALTQELVERAMAERVNVVITPSPTTEEMALALVASARRNGYEVEVAALAVNHTVAAAQSFQRSAIPGAGFAHQTDSRLAAEAANIGKALRRIEANGVPARIELYDRTGQIIERDPARSASDVFEEARGKMTGADKIRVAAAWEEVAEAHERDGSQMPANGQRMREQAHYVLRQSQAASLNFDDRFSDLMSTSKAMAERYGQTLAKLFDADNKAAVATHPELTNAFIVRNVAEREGREAGLPNFSADVSDRIREALLSGARIKVPEVQIAHQSERSRQGEFELER